jgi:transcriptional regulator with XRE-family HTH domain
MATKTHLGENIKSYREMLGIKQEVLAEKMGDDWTQKKISLLEGKEDIEPEILDQVAKALDTTSEVIRNFDKGVAIKIINTTFNSHENSTLNAVNYYPQFNSFEKYTEAVEDIKKLYERLLLAEREKVEMMERLVGKK